MFVLSSVYGLLPELTLLLGACLVAMADLWDSKAGRPRAFGLALVVLGVVLLSLLQFPINVGLDVLQGMYRVDSAALVLKAVSVLVLTLCFVYGRGYSLQSGMLRGGEFFSLGLFALLGMFVMISSKHLMVSYLGLELLTLASYALVALRRDDEFAIEGAMKYFALGAIASGFLLYGMSMLYGYSGSLMMVDLAASSRLAVGSKAVLSLGIVFVVAGLAFKLGAAPFHMWIPDVYHGAPTSVTLFIASAPKLAALGLVARLLLEGLSFARMDWLPMLMVLAVMSLLVGNFAAIAQDNLKRMLGYSTIAQMGFLCLAFVAFATHHGSPTAHAAFSASVFFVVSYAVTTAAAFGVILLMSRSGVEVRQLSDLSGLNARSPFFAFVLSACMLSLAGIPPFIGFYAKFAALESLIALGGNLYIGLAVFAVLMSLVGAFYYLRVVKIVYFDQVSDPDVIQVQGGVVQWVLAGNVLALLAVGLFPTGLLALCMQAAKGLKIV